MHYNVLLASLFISVALCSPSRDSRDTDAPTFWNQITGTKKLTTEHPIVNITKNKVQLKVYYETLCPASIQFVVEQLKPAVKRLDSHLDVHLIPYGHATTYRRDGHYEFRCQHGPPECYCNEVHACAVDVLRNNTHAILFNACLMENYAHKSGYRQFVSVLKLCGRTENVDIFDIWQCVNSSQGSNLLKAYGDETHKIEPQYVPFMTIDGSSNDQDQIAGNLIETICQRLEPKPLTCFDLD